MNAYPFFSTVSLISDKRDSVPFIDIVTTPFTPANLIALLIKFDNTWKTLDLSAMT
jgi:hypothetical protein